MPTGLVIALGTIVGTGGSYAGNPAFAIDKVFDHDLHSAWVAPLPGNGAFVGLDLGPGVAAAPVAVRIAPRPSGNNGAAFEVFVWDADIKGSDVSPIFGLATLKSFTPSLDKWFRRGVTREVPLTGSTAHRYLTYWSDNSGQIAELEFVVSPVAGLSCRPLPPTVSPGGGRWSVPQPRPVTMSCRTTSALIYYTTDGSIPVVSAGAPQGTTRLYAGPVLIPPRALFPATIKAVAYDPSCSTPVSTVATTGPFNLTPITPNEKWLDSEGRSIEAHGGGIVRSGGYWYWVGSFADITNIGHDPCGKGGVWLYKSADLMNWTSIGQIADSWLWNNAERPKLVWRPAVRKWVLWYHGALIHNETDRAAVLDADHIEGPYTLRDPSANPSELFVGLLDFSIFTEVDGGSYLVAVRGIGGGGSGVTIQGLSADGLSATGPAISIPNTGVREAPVMVRNGNTYYLITSAANYYDSTSPFDVRFITGTGGTSPLNATWSAAPGAPLFPFEPTGTNFNGQPTGAIDNVPGVGTVLMMDYWVQEYNFKSNYVWVPLTFGNQTVQASVLPWAPSDHSKPGFFHAR